MELRDELLRTEEEASRLYQEKTGIRPDQNRIGFFRNLRSAADLAYYVRKTCISADNPKPRDIFYAEHGFKSYSVILESHRHEIENSRRISVDDLVKNRLYSSYEISAVSGSYDLMHGMVLNTDNPNHPFAVLKSQIGGLYSDKLCDDRRFYNYSLEKETNSNYARTEFTKHVNSALYDDFVRQDLSSQASQIPAYLFVRTGNQRDYLFRGVYFVNNLIENNRSFELVDARFVFPEGEVGSNDMAILEDFQKKRQKFFDDMYSGSEETIIRGRKLSETDDILPFGSKTEGGIKKNLGYDNLQDLIHDYITDRILYQRIGDLGESLARNFEIERVKRFAPQLVDGIIKVKDFEGFDFESFEHRGSIIRKVKIEVKSTTNYNPYNPFFMSINEYKTMCANKDNYWLYRIFDLNAENPRLYALRDGVRDKIYNTPSDYVCSLR